MDEGYMLSPDPQAEDRTMILPTAEEVRAARKEAGLTQSQAGKIVHSGPNSWQKWETPCTMPNNRQIPGAVWELFLIKTSRLRPSTSVFATPRY